MQYKQLTGISLLSKKKTRFIEDLVTNNKLNHTAEKHFTKQVKRKCTEIGFV